MNYWLIKTEPEEWSWLHQIRTRSKGAEWNGVRNFQASNNLKSMKKGDKAFFYHTGKEKKIIGIVKIIKEFFIDKSDKNKKFVSVVVKAEKPLNRPVSLKEIKEIKAFQHLSLVKQSRLSVLKIDSKSWKKICKMGKIR